MHIGVTYVVFVLLMTRRRPRSTRTYHSFPTRRSSTLGLSVVDERAFEHVRTLRGRHGGDRIPRTERGRIRALNSAWNNAVRYVAAHPLNGAGDDTNYLARSNTALPAVERAQERANAMPGL